ncbi:nuclear transport factor 2 family protein [Streptomyces sp. NPDC055078]
MSERAGTGERPGPIGTGAGTPASFADWVAIRELTAVYNRCFDSADANGWAGTFTETGRLEVTGSGAPLTGRRSLAEFCRSRGRGYVHLTTDPVVRVTGDTARQECALVMLRRHENRSRPVLLTTGRYRDTLVRTPGGWRFTERLIDLDSPLDSPIGGPAGGPGGGAPAVPPSGPAAADPPTGRPT